MPHESPPFAFGDQLLPVNVIEFEAVSFHFALKEAPEDALHAFQFARKQAQLKSVIEIFGDDLGVLVGFEHHGAAFFDDRHGVIAALGQLPDERAIGVGDVDNFEPGAGVFQNAPLHDAKRTPRELNQLDHAARRGAEAPTSPGS